MAWAYLIPLAMQMMQQQGGQNGGQGQNPQGQGSQSGYQPLAPNFGGVNFFAPLNGTPYTSQQGLLGSGAPSSGMGAGAPAGGVGGGNSWMNWLGGSGGGGGTRASGIANGLFNMFFAKNPSDSAMPYLNDIEGKMGKYLNPYMEAGQKALPTLQDQYRQLINNPGAVMNKIGSGFQQSPGYQWQVNQSLDAANKAAAASGMAGSPAEQQQIATTTNQLANQDYYNYLNHGLGLYDQGMGGLSHLYDTGFNASSQMSQGMLQALMAMAQNAYAGANTYNQQMGGGIGSIVGGLF